MSFSAAVFLLALSAFIFPGFEATGQLAVPEGMFDNLHQVNEHLYRSEQPGKKGMEVLQKSGIKTVLNLRRRETDRGKVNNDSLVLKHLPVKTHDITYYDLLQALIIIRDAKKPLLVHCWHGSDRTGAVVAAYRMVYETWPKEKAIEEFKNEKYGHHKTWFPGIPRLLESLDVEKLKSDLKR